MQATKKDIFWAVKMNLEMSGFEFADMGVWDWKDNPKFALHCQLLDSLLILSECDEDGGIIPLGLHFVIPANEVENQALLRVVVQQFKAHFLKKQALL